MYILNQQERKPFIFIELNFFAFNANLNISFFYELFFHLIIVKIDHLLWKKKKCNKDEWGYTKIIFLMNREHGEMLLFASQKSGPILGPYIYRPLINYETNFTQVVSYGPFLVFMPFSPVKVISK